MTLFEKIKDVTGDTKSLEDYAREECVCDYWLLDDHFDDKEVDKICISGCGLSQCIKCWSQKYIENDNESICNIKVGQKFEDKNTGCIKEILRVGDGVVEYIYLNNKTDKIKIGAVTCGKKLFLDENNIYDEKETTREITAGLYRHFKGGYYWVLTMGFSSETGEKLVVYTVPNNEKVWVRPYDMFASEVDHKKYPDVKQKYRFERIE